MKPITASTPVTIWFSAHGTRCSTDISTNISVMYPTHTRCVLQNPNKRFRYTPSISANPHHSRWIYTWSKPPNSNAQCTAPIMVITAVPYFTNPRTFRRFLLFFSASITCNIISPEGQPFVYDYPHKMQYSLIIASTSSASSSSSIMLLCTID